MKPLIAFAFLFLISGFSAYAQDVIMKKNGEEFNAKVLGITTEVVKYKRSDNPDGPLISILKSEVFMIKFANGTKEVFGLNSAPTPNYAPATSNYSPEVQEAIKLSGPRMGVTLLPNSYVAYLNRNFFNQNLRPFITQFGWQFETRIFTVGSGLTGLGEIVPLIGGLEQGKFLPSVSALVGLRGAKGFEFGVGPNLWLGGAGLVFALGTNFYSGGVNFPVNLAVVPSGYGARISLLIGFNARTH